MALASFTEYQFVLLHNLQECAQLILPANLFRSALDTEVVPVMMELFQSEKILDPSPNSTPANRQALYHFINNLLIE